MATGGWYTAHDLRKAFPSLQGMGELALQRLTTLAAGIAARQGITPRVVEHQDQPRYKAITRYAYPLPVWREARGLVEAPADRKPKPVMFNGIRFRSTLEGRTAAFFTGMGWTYEYEAEYLELPSGCYLPDFRVLIEDDWNWIEVKHQRELSRRRDPRWSEVVRRTNCSMVLMYGLWRPVPFEDSGPARMYRGSTEDRVDVHWSEVTSLFPQSATNELMRQKLIRAYREAADETFGEGDGGLSFAV